MAGPSGGLIVVLAQAADRTGFVQAPVAVLILASPLLCFALLALSLRRSVPEERRQRLRLAVGLLPLVALGLYAFYETGVSAETNIRVDLLLIYPALLLTVLAWPALLVSALLLRRRGNTRP